MDTSSLLNELHQTLSRLYKLDNYDIFLLQSLRVARVILSHQFHKQEVARCLAQQARQRPASELLRPAVMQLGEPGHISLIPHVDPDSGHVADLRGCAGQGVVDGSHSFATVHHEDLVRDSTIFITPLHLHAGLSSGLTMIALRTAEFSTLMRSELRQFEVANAAVQPLEKSLAIINNGYWQPYKVAQKEAAPRAAERCR